MQRCTLCTQTVSSQHSEIYTTGAASCNITLNIRIETMDAFGHRTGQAVFTHCLWRAMLVIQTVPFTDSTWIDPPCASMRLLVMFSPRPVPPNFLVALMSPCTHTDSLLHSSSFSHKVFGFAVHKLHVMILMQLRLVCCASKPTCCY